LLLYVVEIANAENP